MWKARFWSYDLVKLVSQPQFIHHIFIDHVSHTVDPVKSKYVSAGSAISAGTTSPVPSSKQLPELDSLYENIKSKANLKHESRSKAW